MVRQLVVMVTVRQLVVTVMVGVRGSGKHFLDECPHKDKETRLYVCLWSSSG